MLGRDRAPPRRAARADAPAARRRQHREPEHRGVLVVDAAAGAPRAPRPRAPRTHAARATRFLSAPRAKPWISSQGPRAAPGHRRARAGRAACTCDPVPGGRLLVGVEQVDGSDLEVVVHAGESVGPAPRSGERFVRTARRRRHTQGPSRRYRGVRRSRHEGCDTGMVFGFGRKSQMPSTRGGAREAATDRPYAVNPTHVVLGTPLEGPWPDGSEVLYVAMGCFWGVERIFWRRTASSRPPPATWAATRPTRRTRRRAPA